MGYTPNSSHSNMGKLWMTNGFGMRGTLFSDIFRAVLQQSFSDGSNVFSKDLAPELFYHFLLQNPIYPLVDVYIAMERSTIL